MLFRLPFPAPNDEQPQGGAVPPAGQPTTPPPPPPPAPPQQAAGGLTLGDGTIWRNEAEVKASIKAVRKAQPLLEQLEQALPTLQKLGIIPAGNGQAAATSAPQPGASDTRIDDRLAEMDFREAAIDAGITGEKREALKLMWLGAGRPKEGLGDWVKATAGKVWPSGQPAQAQSAQAVIPPPPVPPAKGSDLGQPQAQPGGAGSPDGDPMKWDPSVIDKMSNVEFRAAIKSHQEKQRVAGGSSNFRAAAREQDKRREDAHRNSR